LVEATIRGGYTREDAHGKAQWRNSGKAAGGKAERHNGGMVEQHLVESSEAGSLKSDSRRDRHIVTQASDNHAIVSHRVTGYTVLDGTINGVIA
jgi:hypothetical protein